MNALMIAVQVRTLMWRCYWMLPKEYPQRQPALAEIRRDILMLGAMYRLQKIGVLSDE